MKRDTNNKVVRIVIIVFSVTLLIAIIWYISDKSNERRYVVTTALLDEFYIVEKITSNWPDISYKVKMYDYTNSKKKFLFSTDDGEDLNNEKINHFYSDTEIRVYIYSEYIIYKGKNTEKFKALKINEFSKLDPEKYGELVPVAIKLALDNWYDANYVSEFLVKSKNSEAIDLIKRYIQGDFTTEELEKNERFDFTLKYMQEKMKNLFIQYNIPN